MDKLITSTAQMQCTLGSMPAQINVTSQTYRRIAGELIATEADKQSLVNIPTFGTCKCGWPHPPCVPQPQAWQQTAVQNSIGGHRKLTEESFCLCAKGGRITFDNTGANTFVEGE